MEKCICARVLTFRLCGMLEIGLQKEVAIHMSKSPIWMFQLCKSLGNDSAYMYIWTCLMYKSVEHCLK